MLILDNKGLVITRRRKKYKFAHFSAWPNCFELDRNDTKKLKNELKMFFKKKQPIILELAAGTAEFSLELAKMHPKNNFIAIDIKSDRLYTSAKNAQEENVDNIAFVRMHMNEVGEIFPKNSVAEIWLTFPDPHPKKRSAKHRLTGGHFLQQYRNMLEKGGVIKFKTDNLGLFQWSLEQFVADSWNFAELTFDLHESNLSKEYKIKTAYERKFTAQGLPINYCTILA